MVARLGPRVIGEKQYEKEAAEAAKPGADRLGPRVLGPRVADEEGTQPVPDADEVVTETQETSAKGAGVEPDQEVKEKPESLGDQDGDGYATLGELEKALEADPELVDDAFAAETARATPRKGGLQLILATERGKETPREEVVGSIEAALAEL